jgi:hypothetical protein
VAATALVLFGLIDDDVKHRHPTPSHKLRKVFKILGLDLDFPVDYLGFAVKCEGPAGGRASSFSSSSIVRD